MGRLIINPVKKQTVFFSKCTWERWQQKLRQQAATSTPETDNMGENSESEWYQLIHMYRYGDFCETGQ